MRIQNRNKDIKQAMTVGLILVSTPFTISIVTKLFAVLVGFLFGWHNHDILLGTVPVWIFITILMLFIHIYLLAAYDEDCKRVDKQRADYNA
jgi:ABC-type Mn2+/Zn2+ transport system permease subunit